jgi:hypothetical protein
MVALGVRQKDYFSWFKIIISKISKIKNYKGGSANAMV